jgi:apolipoprotein N-acyltransferase
VSAAGVALAVLGGAFVALGIPPYSVWPLVIVGIACYFVAAERAAPRARTQFVVGAAFAWAWLAPGMGWMWHLVPGGFVVAPLLFCVWHGVASFAVERLVTRPGTASHGDAGSRATRFTARLLVRAALHSLVECLRFVVPFGGVPLASAAMGVADTRLAGLARVVGALGVSAWMFVAAAAVAELWLSRGQFGWRARRGVLVTLAVLVVAQLAAGMAPRARDTGRILRVAAVQGGGPQAVLAIDSDPREVITRHLAATRLLDTGDKVDLVVWPENAIDVADFSTSRVRDDIAAEARRVGAPFAVGVTESAGDNFTNAQIVVDVNGAETNRYDKVLRVPYGEYVPLRRLLASLGAPVERIPRDAVAGTHPAYIDVPVPARTDGDAAPTSRNERLAVAISWEVFFSRRINDGVAAGGAAVLNPTNGSSYTGEILQRQQVATSQLRAIESDRYVVQAATTGYSAIIDNDGHVLQRIPIGKQAAVFHDVPMREGRTLYSRLGDRTIVGLLFGVVAAAVATTARRKSAPPRKTTPPQ